MAGFERCHGNGGRSLAITTTTSLPSACEVLRRTPAGDLACRVAAP